LLCHNVHLDRLVPATVLEVGDIFGADHLFCSTPLPYQAIASTACRVARIPASQLTLLLEQRPQFWQHLSALAQQRERLIFFKSLTQMRSYPSQVLKQSLLPQLIEHRVCAGEYLATATPETAGYFWLRRGQVYSESYRSLPPVVGDGWGYPNPVPDDWVAETDLLLYKLLLDAWETADLLQAL
jgi:ATP-binding cassette subfamily B protein